MRKRLPMSQVKEILRVLWGQKRSVRATARAVGVSVGVVSKIHHRALALELSLEELERLPEVELRDRIYGRGAPTGASRHEPDPVAMHQALMSPGVTLELLHQEYLMEFPTGLKCTAFCDRYRKWKKKQRVTMRQTHKAGEQLFIDYSGKKAHYTDPTTGEKVSVELFVATMGASNHTFVVATETQQVPDFLHANVLALEYFGGVPKMIVPDRLKSAVTDPDPYEPTVQRAFAEFARHYGTTIVPARSYKPRDKAKVEVAVQIIQRWILARLRHETHFSLHSLNRRIAELLEDLKARPMKKLGGVSRRELFDRIDAPALAPMPASRFVPCRWKRVRVNRGYHVALEEHYYSTPYSLVGEELEARITARTIELFYRGKRVASHPRSDTKYAHTTDVNHMPKAHQEYAAEGEDLIEWAQGVGPHTETLMRRIFERSAIRIQGWRSGRGLRRVCEKFGSERAEEACRRVLLHGAQSYRPVARMLKASLDLQPLPDEVPTESEPIEHDQVRGPDYFIH
jgi:transposase